MKYLPLINTDESGFGADVWTIRQRSADTVLCESA